MALLFVFAVALVASFVAAFRVGGWPLALAAGLLLLGFLLLTRPFWFPYQQRRGRKWSSATPFFAAGAAAIVSQAERVEGMAAISQGLLQKLPFLANVDPTVVSGIFSGTATILILAAAYLTSYINRDRTTLGEHPQAIETDLRGRNDIDYLRSFRSLLRNHLAALNQETSWSDVYFTPLDAEVEVVEGGRAVRRVTDLLGAIRGDRDSRVFLVLGDPGSGKSVALRKLAIELLDETEVSGRLPIYVNLKEWNPRRPWSDLDPPTAEDLQEFILENLKKRSDLPAREFLAKHFERLLHGGHLFLILDSFDEIPAILDADEASAIHRHLSIAISQFLAGADATRGVVASRLYRRPVLTLDRLATLEVRPFSEMKIAQALDRSDFFTSRVREQLFTERPDLMPAVRNPFTTSLLRNYLDKHQGELPKTLMELYESYLDGLLEAAPESLSKAKLTHGEVLEGATEIAWHIFISPRNGLEAPLSELTASLPGQRVEPIALLLVDARLARLGGRDERRFSFVHRRFNEFLVAKRLASEPARVEMEEIPTDTRWREALALYCGVAQEEHARSIAVFCWSQIREVRDGGHRAGDPRYRRAIHCLRFLHDAFRGRPACLDDFREELATFIKTEVRDADLLAAKHAMEATGLLSETDAEAVIVAALQRHNPWLNQTALRSCRYLPRLSPEVEKGLRQHLGAIPLREFLRERRELAFSLSLSDAFSPLRRFVRIRSLDHQTWVASLPVIFVLFPFLFITSASFGFIAAFLFPVVFPLMARYEVGLRLLLMGALAVQLAFRHLPLLGAGDWAEGNDGTMAGGLPVSPWIPLESITGMILLLCLIQVPLYWIEPFLRESQIPPRRVILQYAVALVIATPIVALVLVGLPLAIVAFWDFFGLPEWLGIGLLAGGALTGLILLTALTVGRWGRDLKRFRQITKEVPRTRAQIAAALAQFETTMGRLRYIEWLRGLGLRPQGYWPDELPSFHDDASGTRLAVLEERWQGLEK